MNPNNITPDDPRLTAYALDEMAPAERAEFAQLLQQDTAAQQAVAEIRATSSLLATALEHEPAFAEAPAGRPAGAKRGVLLRFPQLYYTVSGLAAACFAVAFVLWQNNHKPTQLIEVPLTAPVAGLEAGEAKKADTEKREAKLQVTVDKSNRREQDARKVAGQEPPVAPSLAKTATLGDSQVAVVANEFKGSEAQVKEEGAMDLPVVPSPAPTPAVAYRMPQYQVAADMAAPGSGVAGGTSYTSVFKLKGESSVQAARDDFHTEAYSYHKENDYLRVADQALSTFSIDVDTASYANVRRCLQQGERPPADAVRIEELVNYFPYHYAPPHVPESRGDVNGQVLAAHLEVASAPWNPAHRLVRIGLKGREVTDAQRPPANLVFLLDVSGSMDEPNKLPLVKQSLRLLVNKLRPDDRVAIAVYAGASGLALPSTSAARKAEILDAIDRLEASGSTNGAMGIQLAYDLAKANFIPGGVNRVILATDGDFNVGVTSEGELVRLVQAKAKSGVFLSVLGFGMGNLKDSTLEQLADQGNGNYAYIDSLAEAQKTLVEQAGGTLVTIAKDVKIQVEFNPLEVSAYRLIGYENRLLAKEDFNNDQVDAGEIGAGHTVTALYEVVPVGAPMPTETPAVDALKYQRPAGATATPPSKSRGEVAAAPEMLTVKIRYKEPMGDVSSKLEFPLRDSGAAFASASPDFKFAAAVAAFGMVLRDSPHKGTGTLTDVVAWGRAGLGNDAGGYRAEFISLVERAQTLP